MTEKEEIMVRIGKHAQKLRQDNGLMNIPGLGNRESGKMETGIPAGWKPLFR